MVAERVGLRLECVGEGPNPPLKLEVLLEGGTKVYSEGFCALDERNLPTRTDDVNGIVEVSVVVV